MYLCVEIAWLGMDGCPVIYMITSRKSKFGGGEVKGKMTCLILLLYLVNLAGIF